MSFYVCVRVEERKRQRDREAERHTDRETERQRDIQTEEELSPRINKSVQLQKEIKVTYRIK